MLGARVLTDTLKLKTKLKYVFVYKFKGDSSVLDVARPLYDKYNQVKYTFPISKEMLYGNGAQRRKKEISNLNSTLINEK